MMIYVNQYKYMYAMGRNIPNTKFWAHILECDIKFIVYYMGEFLTPNSFGFWIWMIMK